MKKMGKSKLIVFAIHRPYRAPNEKYRWMQYASYIEQYFDVEYLFLINENDDQILFQSNNYLLKSWVFIKTFIKRCWQIKKINQCDVIIIYRELHWFNFLTTHWMNIIKNKTQKIIFDFDDAIWLKEKNILAEWIKSPAKKFQTLVAHADMVIAGNSYLSHYAQQWNKNVHIIPTCVDTDYFVSIPEIKDKNKCVIGWMGSHSTIQHLQIILPVLKKIKQLYPFVEFKLIAKKTYLQELNIYVEDWQKENEVKILNSFDIGIMPLPNDEWSKGKCGLKILTYLSCEIPCVASNVGVNKEIIDKTNGGFVCNNEEEWLEKLSLLIENKVLRETFGKQGRQGIKKYYSIKIWREKFLELLLS